jgi:hypothetical protein
MTKLLQVKIDARLLERVRALALRERRTMTATVQMVLEAAVDAADAADEDTDDDEETRNE